ncbi:MULTISPECIES: GMC family oxidoreductase [Sphingomonas]|uniref:Choline dehydrogenase-like flavoprotein n=1 Tax=Sphingomonas trueperi TaxID=53317 RepID=A0A7X5XY82_9SPHN|nr:choline dehydrogenase [Sphingomonas trueperi]NJB97168.1 choline dehydrogenase-like flavoprotein [Sphingomonas trueperi]
MFDYIIVGGGSAGCLLAERLSANPEIQVCLLEAGPPDRSPLIHMPIGIALLSKSKTLNWAYETQPQPHLGNRRLFWPRGKTLGGSSSINAMVYIRGHREDYDAWGEAADPIWSFDNVLPLFKAMEANERFGSDAHHGGYGELHVSDLRTVNRLSEAFVEGGQEAQFPRNIDFNGETQDGVGFYQVTQRKGRRWSSARAFLSGAIGRPNLQIITGARATRIILEGRKAVGVTYTSGGKLTDLRTRGEVILSGGAINSPQLLMLSGIGDAAELDALGIPVAVDLPAVGKNLQDHLDITIMHEANDRTPIGIAPSFIPRALAGALSYIFQGKGFLTSNVAEAGGFVKSSPSQSRPNLQFHFLPTLLKDHGRQIAFGYGYTLHVCDLLPKSRGRIGLKSRDPLDDPLIDPAYLSAPEDIETMVSAVRIGRQILSAPSIATFSKRELVPGSSIESEADIIADIRHRAETIYHPVGTCRMGRDQQSVVDPALRVRGVEGLRVVDASIMPTLVAGNTNAPTMMIAERAAGLILRKTKLIAGADDEQSSAVSPSARQWSRAG